MTGKRVRGPAFTEPALCAGGCGRTVIPVRWRSTGQRVPGVENVIHCHAGMCSRCVTRIRNNVPTDLDTHLVRSNAISKASTGAAKARENARLAADSVTYRTDLNPYEQVLAQCILPEFPVEERTEFALMFGLAYRGEDSITRW